MVLPAKPSIKRKRAPSNITTPPPNPKKSKANTPSIDDCTAFLLAYKTLQNANKILTAELQATKAKLNTTEIDRINEWEDQNIVRLELESEKEELKGELKELDDMYDKLKDENEDLREENEELKRKVEGLEREVETGVKRFEEYKDRVRVLGNDVKDV
jgi:predicted  nucleic acid-binding Zn-ribbon protein